jgi:carboxymethylenebutenolidase
MCFEPDSMPPIPPVSGAAVRHDDLTLVASDGTEFAAFEARADGEPRSGIVVLPDVRGLYRFYEELALRLAERGIDAVAIDYFGRTAGVDKRTNDWDYMPHVEEVTQEGLMADVRAAVERLRTGRSLSSVFVIGFCFGGSNAWHQAANGLGLAGAIGFYGNPTRPDRPKGAAPVIDRVGDIACPVLGLMGGEDTGIPVETVDEFRQALDSAGVNNEIVVYDGAPHSFFDRKHDEYSEASADAWDRVLAFVGANG